MRLLLCLVAAGMLGGYGLPAAAQPEALNSSQPLDPMLSVDLALRPEPSARSRAVDAYAFAIKDGNRFISDQEFLERVRATSPDLSDRLRAYTISNISGMTSGVIGLVSLTGTLILLVVAIANGGPLVGLPNIGSNPVTSKALEYGSILTMCLPAAIAGGIVTQYTAPGRQFNVVEAMRAAKRYNAAAPDGSSLTVIRIKVEGPK